MASRGGRAGSLAPSEGDGGGVSAGEQEGPPPPPLSRVAQLQGRRNQLCYPIDILTLLMPALGTLCIPICRSGLLPAVSSNGLHLTLVLLHLYVYSTSIWIVQQILVGYLIYSNVEMIPQSAILMKR